MEKAIRSLEITILSAEGLRLNRKPVKKNTFVIIRTEESTDPDNQRCTSMDREGGSYPSWNQKLAPLPLPNSVQSITLEVQCKTSSGGTIRTLGTSKVPISDFMGDYTQPHYLHFLSYRLRDRNGERNGIINFSVRMYGSSQGFAAACPVLPPRPLGFPATTDQKINGACGSGPAIGIPVPVAYNFGNGYDQYRV